MVGFYLQLWNHFRQINHIRTLEEYPTITITMKIWDSGDMMSYLICLLVLNDFNG